MQGDVGLADFKFVQPDAIFVRLLDVGVLLVYFIGALIAYVPASKKEQTSDGAGCAADKIINDHQTLFAYCTVRIE